jgi:glycerol-3-phosphate O-acyltransferase / dihydroxyacetone phosphate acyltransferase
VNAFYWAFRAVVSWLVRAFYRVEPAVDPAGALAMEGPVMFVGNHPNGLVDPALFFVLARRQVTFLAKAPLFRMPVIGWMVRALGALPVYRRQDDPGQMGRNAGTLEAAAGALAQGRCITIFPEGKSHSEPQLQELKTGAARIALRAAERGARVRIVPIGLTYSEKNRFRSSVHVEVGAPIEVSGSEQVQTLTDRVFEALHAVTLNLEQWEDLPLLQTAEALYALKAGGTPRDPERLKAFARGMRLLHDEQPQRYLALKTEVLAVQERLSLVDLQPEALTVSYRPTGVARFVVRNALALALLPLFVAGMALFVVPYWVSPAVVALLRVERDTEATVKVLALLLLAPLWLLVLTVLAWLRLGPAAGLAVAIGTLPLALFTRYYFERRAAALEDVRTFFVLMSRRRLRQSLSTEGARLAGQLEAVADELAPRVG